MKNLKGLLFGIIALLGIGVSSSFYVDLTSVNPIGGSVYNVLGFVSAHRLLYYNNGNWPLVNQSGVYNTSLTSFSSTNNNSFILNDSIYLTDVYQSSGNLFLVFNDGTNFGFGNSYSSSFSDYSFISTNGGIRLFFDTPVGSVGNNPILNFNISNLNDSSNIPVVGYESYSTRNVATNLGLIIDYGTQGIKGKHFGLDSWGYSYGVNFSSDSSQISWDSFSFSSIGSKCLKSSLDLGLSNFDHLVDSNCMNLGILVLKNNGYDFNAGGQGKYLLLSKNPDSYSSLLYEVLDCNSYDNMDWLPNLMDSNNCVSLQHGTIDGVLPFTDSSTSVSISSLNGFFGSIFNSSLYGYASFDDYGLTFLEFRYGDCYNGGYWDYCIGPTNSFSKLSFNPSTSIPSIKEIYISNGGQVGPGGNGNQSFPDPILNGGVFDSNTFLIEESIKCYLTSGEVCNFPFTYENSTNYVNNYDHQERVRNSTDKTGYLTFNNSVDMLSQYCLNVNTIQYAFCSQLYLYEGSPITYYYNNGYFNYIISGSGREFNLGTLWSGQLGYAYCEGPFCSNFNEGLPQFIKKDTGDYSDFGFSGEYVSLDFFKNYFENGFFFQCPFSYSGSYFTIGSKLIDRLDKHDPLKPINCMIAGFSYGIKSSFFGDSKLGLSHSGVLMKNIGPSATRFYTFLDVVLSLGYVFLFSKLFKFLKKH